MLIQKKLMAVIWGLVNMDKMFPTSDGIPAIKKKYSVNNAARLRHNLLKKNPRCYLCKKPLTEKTATLDHYIPKSKGGKTNRENCKLACDGCNQEKADKMPKETDDG